MYPGFVRDASNLTFHTSPSKAAIFALQSQHCKYWSCWRYLLHPKHPMVSTSSRIHCYAICWWLRPYLVCVIFPLIMFFLFFLLQLPTYAGGVLQIPHTRILAKVVSSTQSKYGYFTIQFIFYWNLYVKSSLLIIFPGTRACSPNVSELTPQSELGKRSAPSYDKCYLKKLKSDIGTILCLLSLQHIGSMKMYDEAV